MDEIVVAQNKYISSKRASRLTGYAQDYIGQLVRLGKVNATKVGKAWFVDEAALMRHIHGSNRLSGPVKGLAEVETRGSRNYTSAVTAGITYPSTWKPITYLQDDSPLNPISDSRDEVIKPFSVESSGFFRDTSTRVSVQLQRRAGPARRIVVASSVDGVRFDAPKVEQSLELASKLASKDVSLPSEGDRTYLFAHSSDRLQQQTGDLFFSWLLKIIASGLIAAVLVFFVPFVL